MNKTKCSQSLCAVSGFGMLLSQKQSLPATSSFISPCTVWYSQLQSKSTNCCRWEEEDIRSLDNVLFIPRSDTREVKDTFLLWYTKLYRIQWKELQKANYSESCSLKTFSQLESPTIVVIMEVRSLNFQNVFKINIIAQRGSRPPSWTG